MAVVRIRSTHDSFESVGQMVGAPINAGGLGVRRPAAVILG